MRDKDVWNFRENISGKEIHQLIPISHAINCFKSSLKNRIWEEVCVLLKLPICQPSVLTFRPAFWTQELLISTYFCQILVYNGFKFINVVFVSLCLSQFKINLIIFHDTAWSGYAYSIEIESSGQVQDHVTIKPDKFNIKPEATRENFELSSYFYIKTGSCIV